MHRVVHQSLTLRHKKRDYELFYFIRPGRLEPLLFLHGLGGSKADFVEASRSPALRGHTLVAFDFPGCGQSSYFDEVNLTLEDLAEITSKFCRRIRLRPFTLIGHSMGGATALLYCVSCKAIARRFINVEGNLVGEDCLYSRDVLTLPYLGREEEYFRAFRKRQLESGKAGFSTFAQVFRQNVSSERAWHDYCQSLVFHSDNGGLLEKFLALRIRRLFLYGSENRTLSYLPALKTRSVLVAEIPASNHFPFYSNPDDYYQAIADFVSLRR